MERLLWRKLQPPSTRGLLPRPRLLDLTRDLQFLVVQAPPGAGKTAFLAQWLEAAGRPAVCYSLDEHDRDGRSFAAHVSAGFRKLWPDWEPPAGAVAAPADLAAELVSEAGYRPPAALALDGLEAAFGQAYLADFLAALLRYAPPTLTLVLSSRAPLPVDLSLAGNGQGAVRAADLAFTPAEAEEWLGPDTGWQEPMRTTEGYPLALALWKQQGPGWQAALTVRLTEALPPHADPEVGKALVREWLGGRLLLTTFAHQLSCAEPGVDQLWREVHEVRIRFGIDPIAAKEPLDALWDRARGEGNRKLIGAVALLQGEFWNARGEYGLAMESWRRAFEADPILELTGPHSVVLELRDQGYLEEAEALARRCVAARVDRGDLQALAFARFQHAAVLLELDRLEEAEQEFSEAQRLAGSMGADPFYAIVSVVHRALLEAVRGNGAAFRRLAEEGYAMARDRRSPFFEAMCGHVLAVALLMWGEREPAMHLLAASLDYLTRAQAKWHLHVVHLVYTRLYWAAGQIEAARRHLDEALGLAARQGYIQYLITPRSRSLPLVTDALIRSVEPAFCQEILARMGLRALPALLEMTGHTDPATRRAALYPLAALGGSEAATAIRQLLYDPDESVRDTALLALRSLGPGALPATPAPRFRHCR